MIDRKDWIENFSKSIALKKTSYKKERMKRNEKNEEKEES